MKVSFALLRFYTAWLSFTKWWSTFVIKQLKHESWRKIEGGLAGEPNFSNIRKLCVSFKDWTSSFDQLNKNIILWMLKQLTGLLLLLGCLLEGTCLEINFKNDHIISSNWKYLTSLLYLILKNKDNFRENWAGSRAAGLLTLFRLGSEY